MTTNPGLAAPRFLAGAWDMELSEASFLPDAGLGALVPGAARW